MKLLKMAEVKEGEEDFKSDLDLIFDSLAHPENYAENSEDRKRLDGLGVADTFGNEKSPEDYMCLKYYSDFKKAAGDTLESIIISVAVRLKAFNLPKVMDLTCCDTLELNLIGDRPTALYIVIPSSDNTFNFLAAMMYTQMFDVLYPRTDSQYITDDMEQTALDVIEIIGDVFGFGKVQKPDIKKAVNNSKVTGHHAIIPTVNIKTADINTLPQGDKNILTLIAHRLLCASAEPHKYESLRVEVTCENNIFTASGKTVLENGWKEFEVKLKTKAEDKDSNDDDKTLPEIKENDRYDSVSSKKCEHWTSPPKPYTEDTLLSAMETAGNKNYDENSDIEKKGLGTPATRAATIEKIISDGYAERIKKQIVPTETGINLIDVVPDEIKSAKLTADWESKLQQIEHGKYSADDFMNEITDFVKEMCEKYSSIDSSKTFNDKPVIGKCPRCGKMLSREKGVSSVKAEKAAAASDSGKNQKYRTVRIYQKNLR